ncbi:hypothetical protein DFH09DRAFT_1083213 [Mycena vulgaris]|nr:hypothetical protein DFH09DRAFT_1083213 [Mycena vulgaris]
MPRSSRNNRNSVRQVIVTRKQPKKWWTQSAPGAPLKFTTHGIGKKLAKKHDVDTTRSTSSGDVAVILLYTEREESDDDSYDDDQDYSYLPEVSPTCGDSTTSAPALTFPPPHVMMAAAPSPQENQVSLVDESSAEDQMDVDPTSVPTCATPLITKPQLTPSNILTLSYPRPVALVLHRLRCRCRRPNRLVHLALPRQLVGPVDLALLGGGAIKERLGSLIPNPRAVKDGRTAWMTDEALPTFPWQTTIKMTLHEWRARKRKRKDDEKQTQAEVREREPEQGRECEQDKERECEKNTRGANMENEVVPGKPVDLSHPLSRQPSSLCRCRMLEKSHSPIPLLSPNALNAGMLHLPDAPNRPSPSKNITDTPTAAPTAFVKHLAFRNPASANVSRCRLDSQELNHSVDVGTVAVVSLPNIKHPTAALPNEMRISWDPRTEMRARLWICDEEVLSVQDILDRAYTLGCPLRIWMPAAMHRPADPPCYRLIPKLPHAVHKPLSAQTLALYEANVEEIFARLHTRAALLEEWAPRQSVDNLWQPGYAAEGSTTFDPNVDGFRFCLTQNEIDTLLGCTQSGSQIWPPLEFFERYDMWPGQWTQGNETWFAARVHDIRMRHDRGLTRTKSKWRSQLPLFSHEKMQDIRTPGRAPEAKSLIAKIKADFPKAFEGIHLTPVD